MSPGRAIFAAVDVGGAGDGEGVLGAELAHVCWLVVVLSGQALVAVYGAWRAVSPSRATFTTVDVGGARDCEGVLGTIASLCLGAWRAV